LRRQADVVFPRAKVAVFVDGCFWHGCAEHGSMPKANAWYWDQKIQRNRQRDMDTNRVLTVAGWQPLRVWEHENAADAAARVALVVRERRARRS